jgi:hypothetical protein
LHDDLQAGRRHAVLSGNGNGNGNGIARLLGI